MKNDFPSPSNEATTGPQAPPIVGFPVADGLPSASVQLSYLMEDERHLTEKPYYCTLPLNPKFEHLRTNTRLAEEYVSVTNVRRDMGGLRLETHGLQFMKLGKEAGVTGAALTGGADVRHGLDVDQYMASIQMEAITAVKELLGAQHCLCYDYRFRKARRSPEALAQLTGSKDSPDEPARIPHVDQTREGGLRRIKRHLSKEHQEKYLNGLFRLRIMNVWRPTAGPVLNDHLAFCDPSSVAAETDLVAVDRVGTQYIGEVYYLMHNPRHRWHWLDRQEPDEATVFVSYDSSSGPVIPHVSVHFDGIDPDLPPRESLELRLIVVTSNDS